MGFDSLFARPHLAECVPDLVATARGDKKATLVIQHAKLVNVTSGEKYWTICPSVYKVQGLHL